MIRKYYRNFFRLCYSVTAGPFSRFTWNFDTTYLSYLAIGWKWSRFNIPVQKFVGHCPAKVTLKKMEIAITFDLGRIGSWEGAHWNQLLEFYKYAHIWISWRAFEILAKIQKKNVWFIFRKSNFRSYPAPEDIAIFWA